MLDKQTNKVLKVLNSICDEGTYKVIDYNNLIEKFPRGNKTSKESLDAMLDFLKAGQYIDIKYAENDTYCLSVLPKGRMTLEERNQETKIIKKMNKMFVFTLLFSGIMAFLGAFLAIFLYARGVF